MSSFLDMPPAKPGDSISTVETPALLVDLDVFDANCAKLNKSMTGFPDVNVRVHCKAHKCAEIAKMQLEKLGGKGVCCQKLCEAVAMVEGGVLDVFLTNEVVSLKKIAKFVGLAKQGASLKICVDDALNLEAISQEACSQGVDIGLVVEMNVGQNRCGVESPDQVLALAKMAMELDGVYFEGIQAYHGGLQHIRDPQERRKLVQEVVDKARAAFEHLKAAGVPCGLVTGGGSGSYKIEAGSGLFTEVQPGSFCFSDVDYGKNIQEDSSAGEWDQSLFVLGTVMSVNSQRRTVVLDSGLKALSYDSGPPAPWPVDQFKDVKIQNGGDEHGIMVFPEEYEWELPKIGSIVKLIPGHCDPTVNMFDWIVGFRGEVVQNVWQIRGRGPGM